DTNRLARASNVLDDAQAGGFKLGNRDFLHGVNLPWSNHGQFQAQAVGEQPLRGRLRIKQHGPVSTRKGRRALPLGPERHARKGSRSARTQFSAGTQIVHPRSSGSSQRLDLAAQRYVGAGIEADSGEGHLGAEAAAFKSSGIGRGTSGSGRDHAAAVLAAGADAAQESCGCADFCAASRTRATENPEIVRWGHAGSHRSAEVDPDPATAPDRGTNHDCADARGPERAIFWTGRRIGGTSWTRAWTWRQRKRNRQ